MPNLADFVDLNVMERTLYSDADIVPSKKAKWIKTKKGKWMYGLETKFLSKKLQKAINNDEIPQMINISKLSREGASDIITYVWEDPSITKAKKAEMRRKGDYSYINKGLFKKVYNSAGKPIIYSSTSTAGITYESYVYKAINTWGDSLRANEFYGKMYPSKAGSTLAQQGVFDNGYIKVDEVEDSVIEDVMGDDAISELDLASGELLEDYSQTTGLPIGKSNKPEFSKLPSVSSTPTMTYAGIGSRQTPSEGLKQMTEVAKELEAKGYTLNTGVTFGGKKEGADKAFDDGTTKKNLFSPENQGSRTKEQVIAKEIHPNPNALTAGALKLMARNTNQVFGNDLNTPVDFVLFYAKETKGIRPEGGTGQAVEMARLKGIPTINLANPNWRVELDKALKGKTQPVIDSSKKINIYAGTGENAELSNFAVRPFETADGLDFQTVEGAFQAAKLNYSLFYRNNFDAMEDIRLQLQENSGAAAKALGRQIKGLDTKAWDKNSSKIMKDLLRASFEQNPQALQKLLATGNAELTHTQDNTKWAKEFPKLLMEVREELNPNKKEEKDPFPC